MAFRKRYKRKRKFKRRSRRSRKGTRKTTVQKGAGFSAGQIVKLNYCSTGFSLDATTGTVTDHMFSATSLYDPDVTGVGHQPMAFDQWMTFYDHYCVLGSKITVTAMTTSGGLLNQHIVGITLADGTANFTGVKDFSDLVEQGRSTYRVLGQEGSNKAVVTMSKNFSGKKFFQNPDYANEKDHQGTAGTSPDENAYFHVWTGSVNITTDPDIVRFFVRVQYIVKFTEPKILAQS